MSKEETMTAYQALQERLAQGLQELAVTLTKPT